VLGEGLGQAVGQGLEDDRGVVVVVGQEAVEVLLDAQTGGDGEAADPVGLVEFLRCDVVGQAEVGSLGRLVGLLAQAVQGGQLFPSPVGDLKGVPLRVRRCPVRGG
jgi:hypothetical protein